MKEYSIISLRPFKKKLINIGHIIAPSRRMLNSQKSLVW